MRIPLAVSLLALSALALTFVGSSARAANIPIVNPSFEANSNSWPGNGPIDGWTGGSGTNPATGTPQCCGTQPFSPGDGSSPPGGGDLPAPNGTQWAYIQESGTLSQTLTGFTVGGLYQLSYYDAHRLGDNGTGDTLTSQIGGVDLLTTTPSATAWNLRTVDFFATAQTMTLDFIHTSNPLLDQTVTIDDVGILIIQVPEPTSIGALSGLGAVGLFIAVRRRRNA
jgi:PEP-CTERM motif